MDTEIEERLEEALGRPLKEDEKENLELAGKFLPDNPFEEGSVEATAYSRGCTETLIGVAKMMAHSMEEIFKTREEESDAPQRRAQD